MVLGDYCSKSVDTISHLDTRQSDKNTMKHKMTVGSIGGSIMLVKAVHSPQRCRWTDYTTDSIRVVLGDTQSEHLNTVLSGVTGGDGL